MYDLNEKQKKDHKDAIKKEDEFKAVAGKYGFNFLSTTTEDDRKHHIDVRMVKNPYIWNLDVKDEKDETILYDCTWLELKNVEGNTGWLFAPKLHGIAFKRKGEFVVIDIMGLRKVFEEKIKFSYNFIFDTRGKKIEELLYCKYNRSNFATENKRRIDVISLVRFEDILPYVIKYEDIKTGEIKELRFKI